MRCDLPDEHVTRRHGIRLTPYLHPDGARIWSWLNTPLPGRQSRTVIGLPSSVALVFAVLGPAPDPVAIVFPTARFVTVAPGDTLARSAYGNPNKYGVKLPVDRGHPDRASRCT
ncbi:hypothetical protein ACIRJ3_35565 [Streptomyces anulatus]